MGQPRKVMSHWIQHKFQIWSVRIICITSCVLALVETTAMAKLTTHQLPSPHAHCCIQDSVMCFCRYHFLAYQPQGEFGPQWRSSRGWLLEKNSYFYRYGYHSSQFTYFLILTQSPFVCWWHPVVHILPAHHVQWKYFLLANCS